MGKIKLEQTVYTEINVTEDNLNELLKAYIFSIFEKDAIYGINICDNVPTLIKEKPVASSYSYYDNGYREYRKVTPTPQEKVLTSLYMHYHMKRYNKSFEDFIE